MTDMDANTVQDQPALPSPTVMIFGSSACARKIAANLAEHGIQAWLATRAATATPAAGENWLTGVELSACRGFAKDFDLRLKQDQTLIRKRVPAIVVAEDDRAAPNYATYGLEPGQRVLTLSDVEAELGTAPDDDRFAKDGRIAWLCGWQNQGQPAVTRRMLAACLQLQRRAAIKSVFMTGNLKVAADGAEALVQAAKGAGTLFVKFTRRFPTIDARPDGRFEIDYVDETTRSPFRFTADWIVVDETVVPGHHLDQLALQLAVRRDNLGFAQSDNVRRLSNATNRRGVFVAGGSRGLMSRDEKLADADRVTLQVLAFLDDRDDRPAAAAGIDRGRCARCLTCYRLCPHTAIEIGTRIDVIGEACQGCGICLAGCPARAIEMAGLDIATPQPPPIVVLGCARSAGQAHALARQAGLALPDGVRFVEVPCGGSVSSSDLLAAIEAGAQGVMLCTCHADNCQSEIGNRVAAKRTEAAQRLLQAAGIDAGRIQITSLAANMGNEFAAMVAAFAARIEAGDAS